MNTLYKKVEVRNEIGQVYIDTPHSITSTLNNLTYLECCDTEEDRDFLESTIYDFA
jgi:hypothetical protein